jgi:Cadherin-like beta sandwich domain
MKKQKRFHANPWPWEIGALLGVGGIIWWLATRNKTPGGSADTKLSTLVVIPNGTLSPAFSPSTKNYTATVPAFVTTCTVTYACEKPSDVIEVGIVNTDLNPGSTWWSSGGGGETSANINLNEGTNHIFVSVYHSATEITDYDIVITRS